MDTDTFYQLAGMIQGMGVMSAVWASVPSILAALGLWLFYASCRNRKTGQRVHRRPDHLKGAGLHLAIYVGICALFLVVCAIFVPFLVLSGAEVTYNGSSVEGPGAGVIVALVIFVFALAAVVVGLTLAFFHQRHPDHQPAEGHCRHRRARQQAVPVLHRDAHGAGVPQRPGRPGEPVPQLASAAWAPWPAPP